MSTYRNHFVPKFYLRLFGNTPRQIHLYNLARRQAIPNASLRDQCYAHDVYGENEEVEHVLGIFERRIAPVVLDTVKHSRLPEKGSLERELLYFFVAFQLVRTDRAG